MPSFDPETTARWARERLLRDTDPEALRVEVWAEIRRLEERVLVSHESMVEFMQSRADEATLVARCGTPEARRRQREAKARSWQREIEYQRAHAEAAELRRRLDETRTAFIHDRTR